MKRKFRVIFKVNNRELMNKIFDSDCNIGNGLYAMWLGGNKNSTYQSIENRTRMVVNSHKGLNVTDIIDILEIE